tara:strand:- start:5413 stop:5967 length:555 start_codon:yes stop_codon:yes gene_type:complete
MKINIKKIIFILLMYLIYINFLKGYYSYYPTIPIYPNNDKDLSILKKEMKDITTEQKDLFFKTNDSVVFAFLPYVDESKKELLKISKSQNNLIYFFKYLINRRRPYQIDTNLNPLSTKTSQTPSYPAGHAYQALLVSKYLSKKYPEKTKLFSDIAYKCDECRVKAGIHYVSDGVFSKKLFNFFN